MERQRMRDRMPTQQELRRSGANTLSARIDSHGGLAGVPGMGMHGRAHSRAACGLEGFEHLCPAT